jgi:hypothetical protein
MLVRCFWEAVTSNSPFAVNLSQGFMRQELEMVERQHQQQHHRTIPSFPSFLHPLQPHSLGSNTFRTALHRTAPHCSGPAARRRISLTRASQFKAAQFLRLAESKGNKTLGNTWYVLTFNASIAFPLALFAHAGTHLENAPSVQRSHLPHLTSHQITSHIPHLASRITHHASRITHLSIA